MFFVLLPTNKFKLQDLYSYLLLICETHNFIISRFQYFLAFAVSYIFLFAFFLWSLHHSKDCIGLKAKPKLFGTGTVQENRACKQQGFKSCHISWLGLLGTLLLYRYTCTKFTNIYICAFVCVCICTYTKWYIMTLTCWLWSHTVWF